MTIFAHLDFLARGERVRERETVRHLAKMTEWTNQKRQAHVLQGAGHNKWLALVTSLRLLSPSLAKERPAHLRGQALAFLAIGHPYSPSPTPRARRTAPFRQDKDSSKGPKFYDLLRRRRGTSAESGSFREAERLHAGVLGVGSLSILFSHRL